ncbi:MAG: PP2C family protein-serine/threonine phosphatase [bacterium]|nr:PP2C family protein-serine/threonine phosphatase [bacterium]
MTASPGIPVDAPAATDVTAALHVCRSEAELGKAMGLALGRLLPATPYAIYLAADDGGHRVELVSTKGCPWQAGDNVEPLSWQGDEARHLVIEYGSHRLGALVVAADLAAGPQTELKTVVTHYGVALVNLALNAESRQSTENYCASLQALEEGIVLFQEEDPDAVQARLLSLASSMLHATASALYVLNEVGDTDSGLTLQTTLGMPEALLEGFHGEDETAWPDCLFGETRLYECDDRGALAGLDPVCVPPILQNVVALPLRYHGIDAGLCVLFNVALDGASVRDHLGRVQSLGQLGAALIHRLQLEEMAVQNRAIARELQIAESIQKRLLPTTAPETKEYEFSWSSIAAQHIGGDYLDVMSSELGDVNGVVADVSGHGINSALLMSSFRSTYRGDAPWMEPGPLAASLNEDVCHEVGQTGMFITAVAFRLEARTRRMSLTSAGHNPVMIYRAQERKVEWVESDGPMLGFCSEPEYTEQMFELAPDDVVLLYTDGVTEAANDDLDMYGEERLADLLASVADQAPWAIVRSVRGAVREFTGCERFDDDMSILVFKAVEPPAGAASADGSSKS